MPRSILLLSILLLLEAPSVAVADTPEGQRQQPSSASSPSSNLDTKKKSNHECERRIIVGFARSGRGRTLRTGDVVDSDIQLQGGVRFFATRRRHHLPASHEDAFHHLVRRDGRILTTNIAATTNGAGQSTTTKNVLVINDSAPSEEDTTSLLPWKKRKKQTRSQEREATAMAKDGGEIVGVFPRPVQIRSLSLLRSPAASPAVVQLYGELGTVLEQFSIPSSVLRSLSEDGTSGVYKLSLPESSPSDVIRVVVSLESFGAVAAIQFDRPCGHSMIRPAAHVKTMSLSDRQKHKQHLESQDRRVSGPWPECVGKTVEACRALIEHHAKDVVGRVKAAHPRS